MASKDNHAAKKMRAAHKTATKVKNALRPCTAESVLERSASVSCTRIRSSEMHDRRPAITRCNSGQAELHLEITYRT